MTAITTDAAQNDPNFADLDVDHDAVGAFLKNLADAPDNKEPSKAAVKEEPEGKQPSKAEDASPKPEKDEEPSAVKPEDEAADKGEEETSDKGEADDSAEHTLADDGAYVKIKVGEEEHEVPVKDLQRLYGQEQALTKKSMEVSEQRKAVDAELAKNLAATNALLERAKKRFEPYSKIDFLQAVTQLSPEDYTNLRSAATAAWEDVQFLQGGLNGLMGDIAKRQADTLLTQAKEALKVLSGPVDQGGVEGWDENLYNEVRTFGVKAGLRQDIVDNLVDPAAIRLLHDAMLFRRGKDKVVVTKKVNKTPTKVVKTTRAPESGSSDKAKENAAAKRLLSSGSADDAAELLLARWAQRDAANQ